MKCLFIDTSSTKRIVSIYNDNNCLYQLIEDNGTDLSIKMLDLVISALNESNLTINDIDKIFVVNGPGSFTGIRVGITIAKTIAWALKIDIIPISGLEVLASTTTDNRYIVPLIDARRGFVYGGIYNNNLDNVVSDQHVDIDLLKSKVNDYDDIVFVSYDYIINIDDVKVPNIDILKVIKKHINDQPINPHLVNPIYLKNTEAEERLNNND